MIIGNEEIRDYEAVESIRKAVPAKSGGSIMKLHYEAVTDALRQDVLALRTVKGQEGYIEPVSQCLEEACDDCRWRPVAIYDEDNIVGFAMYGYFLPEYPPDGRLWLDRLLIDARCQGKGYGKAAMSDLLHRLYREYPDRDKIYLSVIRENQAAISLYEQFGFVFSGERDTKGEYVMVKEVEKLKEHSYE